MTKLEDLIWNKKEDNRDVEVSNTSPESSLMLMNYACMLICCGGVDHPVYNPHG